MDLITHFCHRHKLALGYSCKMEYERCKICNEEIYDYGGGEEVYTCSQRCVYSVHRLCAEFPQKKTLHPFHPHHTLVFRSSEEDGEYVTRWFKCSLCRNSSQAFGYHCQECHFVLDPRCAALTPIQAKPPMNMIHHHQQHPLLECVKPDVYYFRYWCQGCGEKLEHYDNVFVCIECNTLLHEICASLPDEIIHPFHIQHPLTLQIPDGLHGPNICHACRGPDRIYSMYQRYKHKVYHCRSCEFTLDVHCASLKPTDDGQLKELKRIISPSHPHPLIQCDIIKNFRRQCFGCEIAFDGFIYACLDCSILLNQSCVDLPADTTHPFHPQHPLRLGTGSSPWGCRGCRKQTGEFSYSCGECKFALDLKCATKSFQFVKLELHNHGLAYFDFEADGGVCHRCPRHCTKYFFRCIDCYFSIHDHCCPSLPHAIKHPCHFHSLIFTRSVIKDVPDDDEFWGEYYCHACEEPRELYHPTYYCAECHFIAHVHCVISEIISYYEREPVPLADKARKDEYQDICFLEYEEWDNEAEETSDRGGNHTQIQFTDDHHKSKDQVPDKQNVREQSKEEDDGTYAYDNDEWERRTESDPKEDENNQAANKERMLQEIDEQINSLKAELAKLLERRAQLVAGK